MTNGAAVCSGMATIGGGTNGYTGRCTERTVRLANMATAATSNTAEAGSISCWSSERGRDIKRGGEISREGGREISREGGREISRAKEREAGKNSNVFPARCAFLFLSRSDGEGKRPSCCAPSCVSFSPIVAARTRSPRRRHLCPTTLSRRLYPPLSTNSTLFLLLPSWHSSLPTSPSSLLHLRAHHHGLRTPSSRSRSK